MRKVRLSNREIHLEQGHFWADGGDDFFIVARSLADVLVAAKETDAAYQAGEPPPWENQTNKVTVIADIAQALPEGAVPAFEFEPGRPTIHRTEDPSGEPVFWIDYDGNIRAFLTARDAANWIDDLDNHGLEGADAEHLLSLKIEGF